MIRFAHPEYFWLLAVIPLLTVLFMGMLAWRRRALKRWSDSELLPHLIPDKSAVKPWIRFALIMLTSIMVIIAMARPQIGTRQEEIKRKGSDIIICLDVSNSMNAEDIRPSRLERSKQAIYRLIDKLKGDRIGLIIFAGQAYVQLPITTDYGAARLFLSNVSSEMVPSQGTVIEAAIRMAMGSLEDTLTKHTSFVIITDGESFDDDPLAAARDAVRKGIVIHTIGMGTPEGAPIPVYRSGVHTGFMKDRDGQTVITRLNPVALSEIARIGNGKYVQATNSDDGLDLILKEIHAMEKKELGTILFTDYEEQFQYFLLAALILMIIELLMNERKSRWIEKIKSLAQFQRTK